MQARDGGVFGLDLLLDRELLQPHLPNAGGQLLPAAGEFLPAPAQGIELGLHLFLFPMHLGGLGLSLGGLTAAGLRPVPQGGPFRLSLLESFPEGFSLLGQAAHLALEPDLLLPGDGKLPSRPGQGGFGGGRLLGQTGDLFFGLAGLFAKIPRLLLQPFDLGPAGEQPRALDAGAARHGAAGVDHLAVQGNDPEPVAVLFGKPHRGIEILRNGGAPEQAAHHTLVLRVRFHQRRSEADEARFIFQALFAEYVSLHRRQGQEGSAAAFGLLEIPDRLFGVLFPVTDQVLRRRTEGRLHRQRIGRPCLHQTGNRAVDAGEPAPFGLLHDRLDALGEPFQVAFHFFKKPDPAGLFPRIEAPLLRLFLGGIQLARPGAVPHLISRQGILQPFHPFTGETQLVPAGGQFLFRRPALFGPQGDGGGQLGQAQGDFVQGRLARHRPDPDIGQAQCQGRRFFGEGLDPARIGVVALGQAGELLLKRTAFRLGFGSGGLLRGDRGLAGGDIALDALAPFLRLLELGIQAGDGLVVVEDIVAQQPRVAVTAGGLFLKAACLLPHLVHPDGQTLGFLRDAVDARLDLRRRLARGVVLGAGELQLGAQIPQHVPALLDGAQPQADFDLFLLPGQGEVFFRLFRLGFERPDPFLQFLHDIPQPEQIILRRVQPPFSLVFAVTVFGNAGGLLKKLPAVLRPGGHDIPDFPLADDGIAVPAEAGIHKQHLHVLQPDRGAVQEIFAFPRPVIPAGDLDVVGVEVQLASGIVHRQRDLREAHRPAAGGAVEDDVLHLGAAQAFAGLLAQHPTHRVADIGLAGAVRPDHSGNPLSEGEHRFIGERFEALYFQGFEQHRFTHPYSHRQRRILRPCRSVSHLFGLSADLHPIPGQGGIPLHFDAISSFPEPDDISPALADHSGQGTGMDQQPHRSGRDPAFP